MIDLYFLNVPVYRLQEDEYYAAREKYVSENLYPSLTKQQLEEFKKRNPDSVLLYQDHLESRYGGPWSFNEIIGYIRLYFLGNQVRGEYYSSVGKRAVRTRTKTFSYRTLEISSGEKSPNPAR